MAGGRWGFDFVLLLAALAFAPVVAAQQDAGNLAAELKRLEGAQKQAAQIKSDVESGSTHLQTLRGPDGAVLFLPISAAQLDDLIILNFSGAETGREFSAHEQQFKDLARKWTAESLPLFEIDMAVRGQSIERLRAALGGPASDNEAAITVTRLERGASAEWRLGGESQAREARFDFDVVDSGLMFTIRVARSEGEGAIELTCRGPGGKLLLEDRIAGSGTQIFPIEPDGSGTYQATLRGNTRGASGSIEVELGDMVTSTPPAAESKAGDDPILITSRDSSAAAAAIGTSGGGSSVIEFATVPDEPAESYVRVAGKETAAAGIETVDERSVRACEQACDLRGDCASFDYHRQRKFCRLHLTTQADRDDAAYDHYIKPVGPVSVTPPKVATATPRRVAQATPAARAADEAPGELGGAWRWQANCPAGPLSGGFLMEAETAGALGGRFLQSGDGDIGEISEVSQEGGSLSFLRRFEWEGVARVQRWTGKVAGSRLEGTIVDNTHGPCTFEAVKE